MLRAASCASAIVTEFTYVQFPDYILIKKGYSKAWTGTIFMTI